MGQRAAFFDLDRTLIPGSSLFLLARGLYERDYYRVRDILDLGWDQLIFMLSGEDSDTIHDTRETALEFVKGRTEDEILEMAREIADERILPRIYDGITKVIEHHRERGDLTFLVTASPDKVAKYIADTLDMTGAIGTKADTDEEGRFTGRLDGELMHGEAKRKAVLELTDAWDIDLDESFAYSDSINDLPLLKLVGHPQVVNPDRKLKSEARERGWPMYDLQSKRLALLIGVPAFFGGLALFGAGFALGAWVGERSARDQIN